MTSLPQESSLTMKFFQSLVFPLLVPVLVGIGSAATTGVVMTARLEERVAHLETQIRRHEEVLDRDMTRHQGAYSDLAKRTEAQDQRLAKLEALTEESRKSLGEIRADIKTLLRGAR